MAEKKVSVRGRRLFHASNTLESSGLYKRSLQRYTVVFYPRGTSGSYLLTLTKESSYLSFLITANTLNFTVRFSCGKTHTADCCFVSGFNWYARVPLWVLIFQCQYLTPWRDLVFLCPIFEAYMLMILSCVYVNDMSWLCYWYYCLLTLFFF